MIRPVRTSPLTLQIKFGAMLFRRAVVWYHRPMTDHKHKMSDFAGFDTDALLSWYDQHARHLPWRAFSPERAPAYHVFLSELMLQQTVVATVIPYFQAFLRRWPDIQALAAADEDEILKAWAGLGYYARARNMLKAARAVCEEYNGRFPERADQLIKLPGIGPYTAGAIAAIAFDQPAVVLDGNIERVLIRFAAIDRPKKQVKDRLAQGYSSVLPRMRLSDFPQAVMDLGATVCTPKQARCDLCPLAKGCAGRHLPEPAVLPVKPVKSAKPVRQGKVLLITNQDQQVVMMQRPPSGLLGGMLGFPSSGWDKTAIDQTLAAALADKPLLDLPDQLKHTFTHFTAELQISLVQIDKDWSVPAGYFWAEICPDDWPSLFKKAWQLAAASKGFSD